MAKCIFWSTGTMQGINSLSSMHGLYGEHQQTHESLVHHDCADWRAESVLYVVCKVAPEAIKHQTLFANFLYTLHCCDSSITRPIQHAAPRHQPVRPEGTMAAARCCQYNSCITTVCDPVRALWLLQPRCGVCDFRRRGLQGHSS